jgi:hypothetical protein
VLSRLKRKYQKYKTAFYLEKKNLDYQLYSELYTVDYQIDNGTGMHMADQSFTFLHWKLMEQLNSKELDLADIDDACLEIMVYNIIPGGNTILHKLCTNGDNITQIF